MEAVGVAANVIAVVDISVKVLSACSQYAKQVKDARGDVQQLQNEVANLQKLARNVQKLLDSPQGARLGASQDMSDTLAECSHLLSKVQETLQPRSSQKLMSRFGVRALKWPFQSRELQQIVETIKRYSNMIGLAMQVDQTAVLLDVDSKVDRVDNTVQHVNSTVQHVNSTVQHVNSALQHVDYRLVLDKLPTAVGASFNSHAEEQNSTCLENTRVELLQHIDEWLHNSQAQTVFWLNGMAGTGKSTISRTVATISTRRGYLGASFFFKRGEADRGNMSRFYTTIAYQLIHTRPDLAPHIKAAIDKDPTVVDKAAEEQFDNLILQPLLQLRSSSKLMIVLIVDALDECDGDHDIGKLVQLFSRLRAVEHLQIKAIITSRPELPIRLGFNSIQGQYHDVVLHQIQASIINHDIEVFFNHRLAEIKRTYNASVPQERRLPHSWPGDDNTQILVQMAVPLFIFAATVCRFLADRKGGNPDQQLRKVLSYKTRSQESKMEATYLPPLEQQFIGLSSREQDEVMKDFQQVIGTIVVLETPLSASALSRLLNISQDVIYARLDMLHSVLSVPASSSSPIRFLHLSFRDFLLDSDKRGINKFWVDEKLIHGQIAANCLRVMKSTLREDICGLVLPGTDRSAIKPDHVAACIPTELQYACRYWVHHLQNADTAVCDDQEIYDFLSEHFLHWLEVVSIVGRSAESLDIFKQLQIFLGDTQSQELSELLQDGIHFIQSNPAIIDSAPLQLYSSLLTFTPQTSLIRSLFMHKIPAWLRAAPLPEMHWDQYGRVLEGLDAVAGDVSFSGDSTLIVSTSVSTISIWRVDTGECIQKIESNRFRVLNVKFSSDSSLVGSICHDKYLRLWRWSSKELVAELEVFEQFGQGDFEFSPDSQLITYISPQGSLQVLRLDTFDCIHEVEADEFLFTRATSIYDMDLKLQTFASLRFSPDSKVVAAVTEWAGHFGLWSTETGECLGLHRESFGPQAFEPVGTSFAFLDASTFLIAGVLMGRSDTVQIRRVDTYEIVQTFGGHEGPVSKTQFSPDNTVLGTICANRIFRIWRVDSGECLNVFKGHSDNLSAMSFSPNMSLVASASGDKTICIWKTESKQISEQDESYNMAEFLKTSPDGTLVASYSENKSQLWNLDTNKRLQLEIHGLAAIPLGFCASSKYVLFFKFPNLRLAKASTGEIERALSSIVVPEVSLDGRYVASLDNRIVTISKTDTFELKYGLDLESKDFSSMKFSPDSSLLVMIVSRPREVWIFSLETGQWVSKFDSTGDTIKILGISHDSELIAMHVTGARLVRSYYEHDKWSNTLQIFNIGTGQMIREFDFNPFRNENSFSLKVAVSRDLQYVAVTNRTKVDVWDTKAGAITHRINLGFSPSRIEFDATGEILMTNFGAVFLREAYHTPDDLGNGTLRRGLGYGISSDGTWVMWNDTKFFWLPPRFRPNIYDCAEIFGPSVFIGSRTGQILRFEFAIEGLLSKSQIHK